MNACDRLRRGVPFYACGSGPHTSGRCYDSVGSGVDGLIVARQSHNGLRMATMTSSDQARVDALRARLRAHDCCLIEASACGTYYIATSDRSIVTNKGFPLVLREVETWLQEWEARSDA